MPWETNQEVKGEDFEQEEDFSVWEEGLLEEEVFLFLDFLEMWIDLDYLVCLDKKEDF